MVVTDEINVVFQRRGGGGGDVMEATRARVVNQILAKLDGVYALRNVLLIGTTNRMEPLNGAMVRSRRIEVQVEITAEDRDKGKEIPRIHFWAFRDGESGRALRCAVPSMVWGWVVGKTR